MNDYGSDKVKTGKYSGKNMIDLSCRLLEEKCRIIKSGSSYRVESGYENYAVICVTWFGANEYCKWLSGKTGENYRLPTEAEWEYASRGGNKSRGYKYAGSDNIDDVSWNIENSGDETDFVGRKKPNELGLYDMSGNVYEWCYDLYNKKYGKSKNPKDAIKGSIIRVSRGGSWNSYTSSCRASFRNFNTPKFRSNTLGLRLVKAK